MTDNDKPKFKQIIASLYEFYRQSKNLSAPTMALWFAALRGYELAIVSAALTRHMRNPDNGQFLPTPADLIKLIEGSSEDVALQAYNKVDQALRQVGPYRTVVFDDPVIHHVVAALGGWMKLGHVSDEDWKFQRQAFVTLYRGFRVRPATPPPRLAGICEAENGDKNREAPYLVGDRAKCLEVMAASIEAPAIAMHQLRDVLPRLPHQEAA